MCVILMGYCIKGVVAQLAERRVRNAKVGSSNLLDSTNDSKINNRDILLRWHSWIARSPPKGQVGGSNPPRGTI